jgi:hypothetical protein
LFPQRRPSTPVKTGIIKGVPKIQVDQPLKQPAKDSTVDIKEPDRNVFFFQFRTRNQQNQDFSAIIRTHENITFQKDCPQGSTGSSSCHLFRYSQSRG